MAFGTMANKTFRVMVNFESDAGLLLAGLDLLGVRMVGLNAKSLMLNKTLRSMALGAGLLAGGVAMFDMLGKLAKSASDTNKVMTGMAMAGDTLTQRQNAYNRAWAMTKEVIGSVADNLEAISVLTPQFGSTAALQLATTYRRSAVALGAISAASGRPRDGNEEATLVSRYVDQSGRIVLRDAQGNAIKDAQGHEQTSAAAYAREMNFTTALIASARGKLSGKDFQQFAARLGSGYSATLTEEGMADNLAAMQIQGGSTAGARETAYLNVQRHGTGSKALFQQEIKYGQINAAGVKFTKSPNGAIIDATKAYTPEQLALLLGNPTAFAIDSAERVRTYLKSHGKPYDDAAVNLILGSEKLSTRASQFVGESFTGQNMMYNEAQAAMTAAGTDQYQAAQANWDVQVMKFHTSLHNLALAFGEQVLPMVIRAMDSTSNALNSLALITHNHPELPKFLLSLAASIATLASVGGIGLLGGGVIKGLGNLGKAGGFIARLLGMGGAAGATAIAGEAGAAVGGAEVATGIGGAVAADAAVGMTGIGIPAAIIGAAGIAAFAGFEYLMHRGNGMAGDNYAPSNTPFSIDSEGSTTFTGPHLTKAQKRANELRKKADDLAEKSKTANAYRDSQYARLKTDNAAVAWEKQQKLNRDHPTVGALAWGAIGAGGTLLGDIGHRAGQSISFDYKRSAFANVGQMGQDQNAGWNWLTGEGKSTQSLLGNAFKGFTSWAAGQDASVKKSIDAAAHMNAAVDNFNAAVNKGFQLKITVDKNGNVSATQAGPTGSNPAHQAPRIQGATPSRR